MGRYLTSGLLTSIFVEKRKDNWSFNINKNFDLKKEYNNLIQKMNLIINTSKYNVIEKEDGYVFNLKLEFINNNIHDLLIEMDSLFKTRYLIEMLYDYDTAVEIDYKDSKFKTKYPLKCIINDEKYYAFINGDEKLSEDYVYEDFDWFFNDSYFYNNVKITGYIIPLWMDDAKYVGEDDTCMLKIINNMKSSYYKSKLAKCLIYVVLG